MKTNPLEKFVCDNKEDFDLLEPSAGLWEGIAERLPSKRRLIWQPLLLKAMAVAAIFIAGYFFSFLINQEIEIQPQTSSTLSPELQELFEAKAFYNLQIQERKDQVFHLAGNNAMIKNEISNEFNAMDKAFAELQLDLADQVANEIVIEAMIQHYRLKLELLEDILQQLQAADFEKEKEEPYVL
ncbi:MAG: hypothetical protein CVT92_02920 [Bacteroidetes bacterium HGW-Bacteroidetes-1]|jgi:hypothetical protein|nr:MAG: hypothetical protein CVT92_02920 [Bacteroidetes bacterium HGW-Bacteroidetes-1]